MWFTRTQSYTSYVFIEKLKVKAGESGHNTSKAPWIEQDLYKSCSTCALGVRLEGTVLSSSTYTEQHYGGARKWRKKINQCTPCFISISEEEMRGLLN